jgi:protein phosphatase
MKAVAVTDVGRVRPANEDAALADPAAGILIVADGMGGHAAGEVASSIAAGAIAEFLREALPGTGPLVMEAPRLLRLAVQRADEAVRARAAADAACRGMGTTVVVALCRGEEVAVAHAGDSRAYALRRGRLERLTQDHSLVARLVFSGSITPAEARTHHLRNVITRGLGVEGNSEPEVQLFDWTRGDELLLCTDGLTGMVEDDEIERILITSGPDLDAAARTLIERANQGGGTDNISAVVALYD